MSDKHSNEKLDSLRERLYERGVEPKPLSRTKLEVEARPEPVSSVPQNFDIVQTKKTFSREEEPVSEEIARDFAEDTDEPQGRSWRTILLLFGLGFFIISLIASSVYILMGRNSVSGENISLSVNGPFTIGGGETLSFQVSIANNNAVPVESATLVLEYPSGTRSGEGEDKELYSDRIALPTMAAGETRNQPVKIKVFGEENQESEVKVSIEYRVQNSNATFYKEAEPYKFKIGSAPIVLNIESEKTISSGQETTITLELVSNSTLPLTDLLVKAEYPSGFDYTTSEPKPHSGRNVWKISELPAEGKATITITGVVIGTESEKRVINFSVGVADTRDASTLSSVMAMGQAEFSLEQPFMDVVLSVDGKKDETVSVEPGRQANVALELENTLTNPVYDAVVEVKLSGNALSDTDVRPIGGHYDSSSNTVRWDSSSNDALEEIGPGDTVRLSFTVLPQTAGLATPSVNLSAKVSGRRVSETDAREEISGTLSRTIKVESSPALQGEVTRVSNDTGPVPPVVGQSTSYTVVWKAKSSANNLSNVSVTTTLPSYMTWTGITTGPGEWSYNPTSRIVEWKAGSVAASQSSTGTFQVTLLPSASQIDRTPEIVGDSHLRADDSFTGTVLRVSIGALTTELTGERRSGTVKAN